MRELLLDGALPPGLAAELVARGRPARTVSDLGFESAGDDAVLAAAAAAGAVLVTTIPLHGRGAAVAVVAPHDEAGRREAVHRHAHAMAAQRPGSMRRYGR